MKSGENTTVNEMTDLRQDLAKTHRSTAGEHPCVERALTEADLAALEAEGYLIIEGLLPPAALAPIREQVAPYLVHFGRNRLEGSRTKRVYSVVGKTLVCNALAEHPRILCALDQMLLPNYLLSQLQAIEIHPGERAQVIHHDDAFYPIPRPRPAYGVATIWAIDDFTADNGATVVLPGSHLWGDRKPTDDDRRIQAVMPAGSVLLMLGTTWHGGGANTTGRVRLAVSAQYCEPWARTQENMSLAVPRDVAASCSDSMKRMLGYSIYSGFMGNVNGLSPLRSLSE